MAVCGPTPSPSGSRADMSIHSSSYGLPSEITPPLGTSEARHVEADEYHRLMANPDAVIVDVRNAYETAIGHFQPPPGGATTTALGYQPSALPTPTGAATPPLAPRAATRSAARAARRAACARPPRAARACLRPVLCMSPNVHRLYLAHRLVLLGEA
mgnify:CR=1 FL=1